MEVCPVEDREGLLELGDQYGAEICVIASDRDESCSRKRNVELRIPGVGPEVRPRRVRIDPGTEEILPNVAAITVVDDEGLGVLKHLDLGGKGGK